MGMETYDKAITDALSPRLQWLEKHFSATVIYYFGSLFTGVEPFFRDFIGQSKTRCIADAMHRVFD